MISNIKLSILFLPFFLFLNNNNNIITIYSYIKDLKTKLRTFKIFFMVCLKRNNYFLKKLLIF